MDDLISRQAAIRWVKTECNPYGNPTLDFESGKKVIEQLPSWAEPDGHEQWPLMQDRRNRLASRRLGWLQNKDKASSTYFCGVDSDGGVAYWSASYVVGVRPIFMIANGDEEKKRRR